VIGAMKGSRAPSAAANEKLFKAAKDDEVKRCEEALAKGADLNRLNDKGHAAVHVAAAFGALNVLVWLHAHSADFTMENEKSLTPLGVAEHIGEEDAAQLIKDLLAGRPASEIHSLVAHAELELVEPPTLAKTPAVQEQRAIDEKWCDGKALCWSDVYGHGGAATEGATTQAGALTVHSAPGVGSWVVGLAEDTMTCGDVFEYHIAASRLNMADAMLLGVTAASVASAAEAHQAQSAFFNPRCGEVWLMRKNRVTERICLESPNFTLFNKAIGATIQLKIMAGGSLALRVVGSSEEVHVPAQLPETLRPCARLGNVADTILLRKATARHKDERASNDSVITEAVLPIARLIPIRPSQL